LGCSAEALPAEVVQVRLHARPSCDLGALGRARLSLSALGDFAESSASAESLPLDGAGALLRFPSATKAVEARVEAPLGSWGYGERRGNELDLLLWPEQRTCSLFRRGGQALALAPSTGSVLAAGGGDPLVSDAIVGALTFDVNDGALESFDASGRGVLREPRAFATATPFGELLLVAGGENPLFGVPDEDIEPRSTAELFDPRQGRFVATLELQNARSRHAALTLRDGRTLLIGGRSKVGNSRLALTQLELVDPTTGRSQIGQQLAPRVLPRAVETSDGRVFVGGGTTLEGAPAEPPGEWLSAVGEPEATLERDTLPLRHNRAFVAVANGILAVGGCEERDPRDDEEAERCAEQCGRGCPPLGEPGSAGEGEIAYDAWWFSPDGRRSKVLLPANIAAPRPVLLPGSDGAPWLVAESALDPGSPRLLRFDPWRARFFELGSPESRLPRAGFPEPVAVGLDTFVWLDEHEGHGELLGLRLGTRSRYTNDLALVLVADAQDAGRPAHLAPDRPLLAPERYDGRLWLDPSSSSPATVSVADTDYADVTVTIHLQGAGSAPPRVLLSGAELGGDACPWPGSEAPAGGTDLAVVTRSDARARLRYRGAERVCESPTGRVTVAVKAGAKPSVIGRIDVVRGAEPAR
jgi:hypothetical protein